MTTEWGQGGWDGVNLFLTQSDNGSFEMIKTAIILVAGRGTRLRPLTDTTPKALIEVGGEPISKPIVDQFIESGISKVIFIVGYLGDDIRSYYTENKPSGVDYVFLEQTDLNGTAGALKLARKAVGEDEFIVVFGDSFFAPGSISSVVAHQSRNAFGVVSVHDPERYGVAVVDGEGNVIEVEEKPVHPKSDLVVGGIYKFSEDVWGHIDRLTLSPRGEYELPDAIKSMIDQGIRISAIQLPYMIDVGTVEELNRLNAKIASGGLMVSD